VQLLLNASYSDLGVVASDDSGDIPHVKKYVDGVEISDQVTIDTSVAGEHVIKYVATDLDGNSASVERVVSVREPAPEPDPVQDPVPTVTPEPVPSEPASPETEPDSGSLVDPPSTPPAE